MSSIPPPPPGATPPPPPPPPPGSTPPPPPNYGAPQPAGQPYFAPKNNGMAVASLVLGLVGIIPCFWFAQIPGLLAVIFGLLGRSQIGKSNGTQKGGGLATAGLIIGAILLVIFVVFIVVLVANDGCITVGDSTRCNN